MFLELMASKLYGKGEEYKEKCMPSVKHGGGSVLLGNCMYCSILKEKMLPSLRFQHYNDTSKSPDLNPIKHLLGILKRQVEYHSPSSIQDLK
ncbi:unnamed protein product [Staurois parvus]|uniref:Uncharacterized protein n=1 Tax=Staurois parvus TaxID=386267 RepID=A0ABN9CHP0_9NEOB|nr:unnamed protein product [Staurois parvus]